MSKFFSALMCLAIVFSVGCASVRHPSASQKEVNHDAIQRISKVEIFYHPAEYSVIDLGGSKASQMAGVFGPLGLLAVLAAEAGSKLTALDRAQARSKEFDQLIQADQMADINLVQAKQLATLIQDTGRDVKLTMIQRPQGERLATPTQPKLEFTAGYAPLLLRVTTGYGAESATAAYKSIAVTEFALFDDTTQERLLVTDQLKKRDNGVTYQTFDGLKSSRALAVESLQRDQEDAAQLVFNATFAPMEVPATVKK